jgi:CHAD domain-containing protein
MSYQIEPNESFPDAIRRIMLEELDLARTCLTERPSDLSADDAIHEARKSFKKLRAALRLVREEIGDTSFKRENVAFRDAGRLLSDVRDSYVLVETVVQLQEQYAGQLRPEALATIHQQLSERYEQTRAEMLAEEERVSRVVAMLAEIRPRLVELPVSSDGSASWRGGLRRVYGRGRRRMARAYAEPVAENSQAERFHEWRKRVKYFWYHLLILQPIWETADPDWSELVHLLSDYLGLEHDLAVLRDVVLEKELGADETERDLLLALIAHERGRLQDLAQPLGEQLYRETPAELVERVVGYWQIWNSK